MIKVGITGKSGFIGSHLEKNLLLYPKKYELINFKRDFFENENLLKNFVSSCDCIIHLAGLNRHLSDEIIYKTNIELTNKIIKACSTSNSKPHIIFASSTQIYNNSIYGKSKQKCNDLFMSWSKKRKSQFTGLVIPNVFGPFGNPYYNSVVSTFCHQISKKEETIINNDSELNLIYVQELIFEIIDSINTTKLNNSQLNCHIKPKSKITVSNLLRKLKNFHNQYIKNNSIPKIVNLFDLQLFNTFLCYQDISSIYPKKYKTNIDDRGMFVELLHLNNNFKGQVSFSTTKPEITRGNHFHIRKFERFSVIKGRAQIELRNVFTNRRFKFILNGNKPSFVDMPIWHTHNITNIGRSELITVFWINEKFDVDNPDTFFEIV